MMNAFMFFSPRFSPSFIRERNFRTSIFKCRSLVISQGRLKTPETITITINKPVTIKNLKGVLCRRNSKLELHKQAVLRGKRISLEHCLMLERWQGPPHVNKLKAYVSVLSLRVNLLNQSWKRTELVYLGLNK